MCKLLNFIRFIYFLIDIDAHSLCIFFSLFTLHFTTPYCTLACTWIDHDHAFYASDWAVVSHNAPQTLSWTTNFIQLNSCKSSTCEKLYAIWVVRQRDVRCCSHFIVVNYEIYNKFSTRTNYYYHSTFSFTLSPICPIFSLCLLCICCWIGRCFVTKMGAAYTNDMNYKTSCTEPDENRWNNPQQFIIKIVLLSIPKFVVQIENSPGTKRHSI